jgi:uncharacterized phiE125 gp8 family phage protein
MIESNLDRDTLPPLMLDTAKAQSRIDHARDDALVTEYLAQAIDDVERLTNATLFQRTITLDTDEVWPALPAWAWGLMASDVIRIALPFNNVSDLIATGTDSEGNPVDVTASFSLAQVEPGGVGTAFLVGPTDATSWTGVTFQFTAGLADPNAIAPSVRRVIYRRAAALYEYREAALPLTAAEAGGDPGVWRPAL